MSEGSVSGTSRALTPLADVRAGLPTPFQKNHIQHNVRWGDS